MEFKKDMLRHKVANEKRKTLVDWVYPPPQEPPLYSPGENTVQWGSDPMFNAETIRPLRQIGVRSMTQFTLQLIPDNGETVEGEKVVVDEEQELDNDSDDLPYAESRFCQAGNPASWVQTRAAAEQAGQSSKVVCSAAR